MSYRLAYTRRAAKDIHKLPEDIRKRIGRALLRYENDPLQYAEKIADARLGQYRFRVGDYRAIFDLEGMEIVILRVGHRSDIYRRL